jgi:hypothetical protein
MYIYIYIYTIVQLDSHAVFQNALISTQIDFGTITEVWENNNSQSS